MGKGKLCEFPSRHIILSIYDKNPFKLFLTRTLNKHRSLIYNLFSWCQNFLITIYKNYILYPEPVFTHTHNHGYWKKCHAWGIFFNIACWGIDLDYCDIEWFTLEMNSDHSVVFEIESKYCILDSFVDCDGYSISPKGILAHNSRYNGHLS